MQAAIYDITLEQGAEYRRTWTFLQADGELYDFTGYTARLQVRRDYDTPAAVVDVSTDDGITMGADGTVLVVIPEAQTAPLDRSFTGRYTLRAWSSGGTPFRLLEGAVRVTAEVTDEQ